MNQIDNPKAPAQSGTDASDSGKLKKYEIELGLTQYSSATIIIEAASLAEAEQKANEIESDEIDFDPVNGDLTLLHISPLDDGVSSAAQEGEDHE